MTSVTFMLFVSMETSRFHSLKMPPFSKYHTIRKTVALYYQTQSCFGCNKSDFFFFLVLSISASANSKA